jgi:hypothetical protein
MRNYLERESYQLMRIQARNIYGPGYLRRFDQIIIPELTDNSKGDWVTMKVDKEDDGIACSGKSSKGGLDVSLIKLNPKIRALERSTGKSVKVINDDFGDTRSYLVKRGVIADEQGPTSSNAYITISVGQSLGGDLVSKYVDPPFIRRGERFTKVIYINSMGRVVGIVPRGDVFDLRRNALSSKRYHEGISSERHHFLHDTVIAREDDRTTFFEGRENLELCFEGQLRLLGISPSELDTHPKAITEIKDYMFEHGIEDDRNLVSIYNSLKRDRNYATKHIQDTALGNTMFHWARNDQTDEKMRQIVHSHSFMLGAVARSRSSDLEFPLHSLISDVSEHPIQDVYDAMLRYYEWWNRGTLMGIYTDKPLPGRDRIDQFSSDHIAIWPIKKVQGTFLNVKKIIEDAPMWDILEELSLRNDALKRDLDNLDVEISQRRDRFKELLFTP